MFVVCFYDKFFDFLNIFRDQTKESGKLFNLERCNRTPQEKEQFYGFGQVILYFSLVT